MFANVTKVGSDAKTVLAAGLRVAPDFAKAMYESCDQVQFGDTGMTVRALCSPRLLTSCCRLISSRALCHR